MKTQKLALSFAVLLLLGSVKLHSQDTIEQVSGECQESKTQAYLEANQDTLDLVAVDMTWPREKITEGIMYQLKNLGFLSLTNVSGFNETALLDAAKWLFNIDSEDKRKLGQKHHYDGSNNYYRGLAPFIPNDASHKELFDMGMNYSKVSDFEKQFSLHEETPFPQGYGQAGTHFKDFMYQHYEVMHKLGLRVMSHIADGFGKPTNYFDKWFVNDTCSTMRLIHYLPRSAGVVQSDKLSSDDLKLTTPIHADSGFLTLLSTFNFPGLQVETEKGVYKSIKPHPNVIVVNIGEMFSRISNYTLKATLHRVLDIGVERFSSPFFFEPQYSAEIPKNLQEGSAEDDLEGKLIYGDWLIENMRQFKEFSNFQKTKPSVKQVVQQ